MLKKIKSVGITIAVLATASAFVACGKNNNNLKVDGSYQNEVTIRDSNNKIQSLLTLVDIKDNIRTTFYFNADKSAVEIIREELIIRGRNLIGTRVIQDDCNPERVGLYIPSNAPIQSSGKAVRILGKANNPDTNEVDDLSHELNPVSEENKELLKKALTGQLDKVCFQNKIERTLPKDAAPIALAGTYKVEESVLGKDAANVENSENTENADKEQTESIDSEASENSADENKTEEGNADDSKATQAATTNASAYVEKAEGEHSTFTPPM